MIRRRPPGRVVAVARYELGLLVRGKRWLPPIVLLGFVVATSTAGGPPPGDAYAFAAAGLVPTGAWLTRITLTGDPPQARACLMAAVGPGRTQLGCLAAAVVAAVAGCLAATAAVTGLLLAGARDTHAVLTAGPALVTGLACSLVGVALGIVCNPPVTRRRDVSVLGSGLAVVLALAASGSPAYAAITELSRTPATATGRAHWGPPAVAAGLLALAAAWSVRTAVRRGVH